MVKLLSNNSLAIYGNNSLVVWPTIGKPNMISMKEETLQQSESFAFDILILARPDTKNELLRAELTGNLILVPLLGLSEANKKAFRGKKMPLIISEIIEYPLTKLDDATQFNHFFIPNPKFEKQQKTWGFESLRESLIKQDVFLNRNKCFKLTVMGSLSSEIKSYLQEHRFLLFDLIQNFPDLPDKSRLFYHSVCLTKNVDWQEFKFLHISDLHISKRNDDMLGVIKLNIETSLGKTIANIYDKGFKKIYSRVKDRVKKAHEEEIKDAEIEVDPDEDYSIPLEKRFRNPNNMFRRFIRFANLLASVNKVDFIAMTGDLVDFCMRTDTPILPLLDFDYPNTNWARFMDIVLNEQLDGLSGYPLIGIEPNEELLVPFFTVPGNHDYRAGHYSINSLNIFKFYGLTALEANAYADPFPPVAGLLSFKNSLMAYYQFINPFQDFCLKFGDHTFIFLDSGPDSISEIKYLLMADPSLEGFNDDQMKYLNLIGEKVVPSKETGRVFLFSHAPILNPTIKKHFQFKFLQMLGKAPKFDLQDFKVTRLQSLGESDPRSDIDLEYHSGGIADNWVNVMEFMEKHRGMALQGHTHKWLEFHTKRSETPSISHTGYGKEIKNPFSVYWDDYVKINMNNPEFFDKNLPLYFQTPALGIQNRTWRLPPGGYRVVEIKNNKIDRIAVSFTGTDQFMQKWHLDF